MKLPELVPVEYGGELVALVSVRRIHIIAPWLLARPAGDPELRFVGYMCLCCAEVLRGRLPAPYTDEFAEAWRELPWSLETTDTSHPSRPRTRARLERAAAVVYSKGLGAWLWSRRSRVRVPSLTLTEAPRIAGFSRFRSRIAVQARRCPPPARRGMGNRVNV
jgi:hypothetical protein